ncbi:MAG: hypothetical protein A2176_02105 [Spirochaetes bacterium RBG_13_51_14]|nr:MAG: hypothetical protein A2176_02105 [Spirochaetes bacterium RBG_13_51_14]
MYDIEKLIPHRGRMKLVGDIIEIDDDRCVTASIVSNEWPLRADGYVDAIILIELTAQTAGVHFGWDEMKRGKENAGTVGWLVGIKNAMLYRDRIAVGSNIVISIEDRKSDDTYAEIIGTARVESEVIGEIMLQVFRPETTHQQGAPS